MCQNGFTGSWTFHALPKESSFTDSFCNEEYHMYLKQPSKNSSHLPKCIDVSHYPSLIRSPLGLCFLKKYGIYFELKLKGESIWDFHLSIY
jgi:hypothetical protein